MTKPPLDDENARGAGDPPSSATSSGAGDPFGFQRWMKDGAPPSLHPLMQHPTASVAAAAAMGFGMASHFAGFMLGAMQGFVDATQKSAKTPVREPDAPAGANAVTETPADDGTEEAATVPEPVETQTMPETDIAVEPPVAAVEPAVIAKAARMARPRAAVNTATAEAAALPDAQAPAQKVARPRRAKAVDDLKRISGVGPKLEQVLNGMGVTRYAQIAGWDAADTARFDAALGVSGRIVRDRWVEQAKALTRG